MKNNVNITEDNLYDAAIIGAGPAGLTAAIYLARARYRVLVMEKDSFGGQITITNEVVNYPGIERISGEELTNAMKRQAELFGAEFIQAEAEKIEADRDIKTIHTQSGDFYCFGILIATGAHPRTIGFKGEEEHKGHGVAYCATCDGEFFTDKEVFVIGGGFAAAEEGVFLTKFASHVTILVREEDFTCAASVAEQAKSHEKITVVYNTEVEEVKGENGLDYIRYKNVKDGKVTEYRAKAGDFFGVFVFAGYIPSTKLIEGVVQLNEQGYVITDKSQKTTVDGIYAAGDVCIKPLRQVVTATGDGAIAATELEKYASELQSKTGLYPKKPHSAKNADTNAASFANAPQASDEIFTTEMKSQLEVMFSKMKRELVLKLHLDSRPVSTELKSYMTKLAELTDKLSVYIEQDDDAAILKPCVRIFTKDGYYTGLAFHGVPGGHEFTSFVLGLYNASCDGQAIDKDTLSKIEAIDKQINMKILVSLSCTMCPDLVVACQRIATKSDKAAAEVYDLKHFEALKEKYNVMSVPCLIINDEHVFFGKKNINNVLEIIEKL